MELPRLRNAHTYDRLSDSNEAQPHEQTQYLPQENSIREPAPSRVDTNRYLKWTGFLWLLFTIIISALIIVTVRIYQMKGTFSSSQKHAYNTWTTFLILVLGLNFFEAFKAFAKACAPRIIAWRPWSQDERELIEDLDSLTSVVRLGLRAGRKYGTVWLCIAWIIFNLLAQTAVAVISLTYSINDGKGLNDTFLQPGTVNASKLSCYYDLFNGSPCDPLNDQTNQALAHAYGELALSSPCSPYNTTDDIWHSKHDYGYYCNRDRNHQQFAYRFNEFNPNDTYRVYPHFTNRHITASGTCYNYSIDGDYKEQGDGLLLFKYKNDTTKGSITIPRVLGAHNGTTWIYRDNQAPRNANTTRCGDRCITMWAHRSIGAPGAGEGQPIQFYECPITMDHATNQTDPLKDIPDDMARLAIAAIGLNGRYNDNNWTQYQFYAYGSEYEVHNRHPDEVAADVAEFAISSISTMAKNNEPIQFPNSQVPHLGSRLSVHWPYLVPLVAGVSIVHLLLFLLAAHLSPPT